ncbi:RICIN domain-containing protein [Nonomuraea sp. NPDC049607]|uniref:RICIN domain-containing protein n=1 Tax=Nonomuraea sp. NPDC049607 TaxID=3154732 RepID=UPI003447D84A
MDIPVRATLINKKSGLALDIKECDMSDGGWVIQWTPHGRTNQIFRLEPADGGYKFIAEHSGKVLAVANASTDPGARVVQFEQGRRPVGPPLATPGGAVLALSLSGDALSVAGKHLPFQRYDLSAAGAASTVCERVGHGLGREEWATYFPDFPYQPACGAEDR